jgi:hypothetical protein
MVKARIVQLFTLTVLAIAVICAVIGEWAAPPDVSASGGTNDLDVIGEQTYRFIELEGLCEEFRKIYGVWPTNTDMIRAGLGVTNPLALIDVWRRPYCFYVDTSGKHVIIASLGADGKPGGLGLNADYSLQLK